MPNTLAPFIARISARAALVLVLAGVSTGCAPPRDVNVNVALSPGNCAQDVNVAGDWIVVNGANPDRAGGSTDATAQGCGGDGPAVPCFGVGAAAEVEWHGDWYPARVLKRRGDQHFIRYDNHSSSWDEWVGPQRIREPR